MIVGARWTGMKTVKAKGPLFDLDRVQAANLVILRAIIAEARQRDAKERPFYRPFAWKALRQYGERGERELLETYDGIQDGLYDVADFPFRVEVGPYRIDVCPLGGECLRKIDGRLEVLGAPGRPASMLDVRPTIFIHGAHRLSDRWAALGEMDDEERKALTRILSRFRSAGILYDLTVAGIVPPVVKVKLDHESFRDREKPDAELRIRCVESE